MELPQSPIPQHQLLNLARKIARILTSYAILLPLLIISLLIMYARVYYQLFDAFFPLAVFISLYSFFFLLIKIRGTFALIGKWLSQNVQKNITAMPQQRQVNLAVIAGRVLRIATSYAILLPLVIASFLLLYFLIGKTPTSQFEQFLYGLIPLAIMVFITAGFTLSLKVALRLVGVKMSQDLERGFSVLPQAVKDYPEFKKEAHENRNIAPAWARRILLIIAYIILIFATAVIIWSAFHP